MSRDASRFVAGDWDQHARRQVTIDGPDFIIDVLTSDIAVHRSSSERGPSTNGASSIATS